MDSSSSNDAASPAGVSLVIGGDSMIGRALTTALDADGEAVFATTRRRDTIGGRRLYADLDSADWDTALSRPFATAYLCAAMARLDACHADPERAMRVNARHMAMLAEALATRGCYSVFLSTNQVFAGTKPAPPPDEPVAPTTAYGRSKAAAERGILALASNSQAVAPGVLRLSKVVEPGMALFASWIERLHRGEDVLAARDMTMAPLPVALVVEALRAMAARRTTGIVQLAATREISYVDAALHIAGRIGAPAALVRPVDSVSAGFLKEQPPPHTLLDGRRAFHELGIAPAEPFAALDACIAPFLT